MQGFLRAALVVLLMGGSVIGGMFGGSGYAYTLDAPNHTVTLTPSTTFVKTTADLRAAFSYLTKRTDKDVQWKMLFSPGQYVLDGQVSVNGLTNVVITSSDTTNKAIISKKPTWDSATSAEYLLYNSQCSKVQLVGLEFKGQFDFSNGEPYYWPDQGVYFGSCSVVKIDSNKFSNFGNAALRVATWERDTVQGVNSFKTQVSNNTFDNFYQTSTTVQDNIHGGTSMSTWINNTFTRIHGSVKFASRTPGAGNIEFFSNTLDGGEHFGLEINNYNNFNLKGNTIRNIDSVAMNIYTAAIPGFPWGDNFSITGNSITNVGRGIRYSHEPATDGFNYTPTNLVIDNNTLDTVHDSPNIPAILVIGGPVNGVTISNNRLTNISNGKYITVSAGSTQTSADGNIVEGLLYAVPGILPTILK